MEDRLDDVAAGRASWTDVLSDFWAPLAADVAGAAGTAVTDIVDAVDASLGTSVLGSDRACPACGSGRLGVKLSIGGGFVGCSAYPACAYTRPLHPEVGGGDGSSDGSDGGGPGLPPDQPNRQLGADPATGWPITLRRGPYGLYIQLGPAAVEEATSPTLPPPAAEGKTKAAKAAKKAPPPRRASLPKGADPAAFSLDDALDLLAYPRTIGQHPTAGGPVEVARGPYGFYVRHRPPGFPTPSPGRRGGPGPRPPSAQLPPEMDPQTVELHVAVKLIEDKLAAGGGRGKWGKGGKAAELAAPAPAAVGADAKGKGKQKKAATAATAVTIPPPPRTRRLSPYLAFATAERAAVTAALGPEAAGVRGAVLKELGAQWSALGAGGKAAWAAANMPAALGEGGEAVVAIPAVTMMPAAAVRHAVAAERKGDQKAKPAAAAAAGGKPPSRAPTAYLLFGKATRPAVTAALTLADVPPKPAAVMSELGARWKALGEADRERWQAEAAAVKAGLES